MTLYCNRHPSSLALTIFPFLFQSILLALGVGCGVGMPISFEYSAIICSLYFDQLQISFMGVWIYTYLLL